MTVLLKTHATCADLRTHAFLVPDAVSQTWTAQAVVAGVYREQPMENAAGNVVQREAKKIATQGNFAEAVHAFLTTAAPTTLSALLARLAFKGSA